MVAHVITHCANHDLQLPGISRSGHGCQTHPEQSKPSGRSPLCAFLLAERDDLQHTTSKWQVRHEILGGHGPSSFLSFRYPPDIYVRVGQTRAIDGIHGSINHSIDCAAEIRVVAWAHICQEKTSAIWVCFQLPMCSRNERRKFRLLSCFH